MQLHQPIPTGIILLTAGLLIPKPEVIKAVSKLKIRINAKASLVIPADANGKQIHVILEVRDDSKIIPLYDYRRIILNI